MSAVTIGDMTFSIPFADLLPPLTEQQYAELKDDIAERGIVVPIIVGKDNRVIDGQHRMKIAAELGLSLNQVPREAQPGLSDDQEHDLCIDLNMHRRQLTAEERQSAVLRLRGQGKSYREIGEVLGIGAMTAHDDVKKATVRPRTVETAPTPPGETEQATIPERIVGKDGRSRPASQPRPQRLPDTGDSSVLNSAQSKPAREEARQQVIAEVAELNETVMSADAALNENAVAKHNLLRELGPDVRGLLAYGEDKVCEAFERHPHMGHILTDIHRLRRMLAGIERRCAPILSGGGEGVG